MSGILEIITDEQKDVVRIIYECAEGDHGASPVVIVNALAGTGKTSTAHASSIVLDYHDHKTLCVVFNKSAAIEGQKRMDGYADVKTTHSLVYGYCGRQYNIEINGVNKLQGNLRVYDVTKNLGDHLRIAVAALDHSDNEYKMGYEAVETVKKFIASASSYNEFFGDIDNSKTILLKKPKNEDTQEDRRAIDKENRQKVITWLAKNVWDAMVDVKSPVPMIHDGYMKLFQLGNFMEKAIRAGGYRVVIIDEAQDSNPSFLHAILSAKINAVTVLIGDPRQGIYTYRGAMNALDPEFVGQYRAKKAIHEYYLTGSFRFGNSVAVHPNAILDIIGVDKVHQIRGLRPENAKQVSSRAILCRTNAGIIAEAVELKKKETPYYLYGGAKNYNMQSIIDLYNMSIGCEPHVIRDPFLKNFKYFRDLVFYAESANDQEINIRLKMIENYGNEIPSIVSDIINSDVNEKNPDAIIITTAHRSKGAEFGRIRLSHDFPLPFVIDENLPNGFVTRNRNNIVDAIKSIPYHERNDKNSLYSSLKKMLNDADGDENNLLFVALSRGIHGVHYAFSKQLLGITKPQGNYGYTPEP